MDQDDRHARLTLRIPKKLHEKIAIEANKNSVSVNNEIIKKIESSYSIGKSSETSIYYLMLMVKIISSTEADNGTILALIRALITEIRRNIPEDRKNIQEKADNLLEKMASGIIAACMEKFPMGSNLLDVAKSDDAKFSTPASVTRPAIRRKKPSKS